ncbi:MAG: hypothetical protein QOI74_1379 [Micromonosporaceae bacterium]|nr:hypothetical protein [Micromonosporaceae bacterium]
MRSRDDEHRLAALAAAELTYREQGATRGALPAGYDHVHRDVSVGTGRAAFDRAVDGLFGWHMHRGAGMAVAASAPTAAPGVVVALRVGWGPLSLLVPCRVVYRVEEPACRGFAYGTLPGHPERGEEAFLVRLRSDGDVRLIITAFSRPASVTARVGGPLTRKVQARYTDRYVRALRRLGG